MHSVERHPPNGKPLDEQISDLIAAIGKLNDQATAIARTVAADRQAQLPLAPSSAPAEPAPAPQYFTKAELLARVDEIERRSPPSLGERSRQFLAGLRTLADQFDPVRPSPKQLNWLDGLAQDAGLIQEALGTR
jgi:hypothetical protein